MIKDMTNKTYSSDSSLTNWFCEIGLGFLSLCLIHKPYLW